MVAVTADRADQIILGLVAFQFGFVIICTLFLFRLTKHAARQARFRRDVMVPIQAIRDNLVRLEEGLAAGGLSPAERHALYEQMDAEFSRFLPVENLPALNLEDPSTH